MACSRTARPIGTIIFARAANMSPTALSIGKSSEYRISMTLAVNVGLISATRLSLVLGPTVYEFVKDAKLCFTAHRHSGAPVGARWFPR